MQPRGTQDLESANNSDGYCLSRIPDSPRSQASPGGHPSDQKLALQENDLSLKNLSEALLDATLGALPLSPERISSVFGPSLEVTKVDTHTADIKVIHGFRAHFRGSVKKRQTEETFENCLIQAPGEQLKKRVLRRGSLSFSDLTELDKTAPRCILHSSSCHRCQWEIHPNEIKLGRRIAVGGFAEVFIAEYQGTMVAVKRMFDHDATAIEQFKQEIRILAKLRHPNLILFMGYCLTPELSIVSEFMQKGCLYNVLRMQDGVPLADTHIEIIAVSVARGMAYLHSREPPILHLDLKSPNILIDSCWRVKITDFGLSRLRHRTLISGNMGAHGTPHWMSPETIRGDQIDEKSDVYSFGVILWELLTGKVPWGNMNPIQVIAAVGFKKRCLPRPEHSDAVLVALMERCCAHDPVERPSFSEILQTLDRHYAETPKHKIAKLALGKGNTSGSVEPPSPAVGTVVEISSPTDLSSPGYQAQLPSDSDIRNPFKEGLEQNSRSIDRLQAFEHDLLSQQSEATPGAMASPFAELASTPMDNTTSSDDESVLDIRSCDAALERPSNDDASGPTPPANFSPFAAYSAMPFVDSGQLPVSANTPEGDHETQDGTITATPATTELRGDVSAFAHKSLKSQVSTVYDEILQSHTSSQQGSSRLPLDDHDTTFFHFDAKEEGGGWKIKVADVEEEVPLTQHDPQCGESSISMRPTSLIDDAGPSARPPSSIATERSHDSLDFNGDPEDLVPPAEDADNTAVGTFMIPPMRFHYTHRMEFSTSPRNS